MNTTSSQVFVIFLNSVYQDITMGVLCSGDSPAIPHGFIDFLVQRRKFCIPFACCSVWNRDDSHVLFPGPPVSGPNMEYRVGRNPYVLIMGDRVFSICTNVCPVSVHGCLFFLVSVYAFL